MVDSSWTIISCLGLVVLALAGISTCILLLYGIITVIKQTKEELSK